MYSIQELNNDIVVNELFVNDWFFNENTTEDGIKNLYYRLNTSISNLEVITLLQHSNQSRTVEFAGITSTLPPNSIKVSITIRGWKFQSSLNILRVMFSTKKMDTRDSCGNIIDSVGKDDVSQDIKYLRVVKDNTVFFGSFFDKLLSDGRITQSKVEWVQQTQSSKQNDSNIILIGINSPQFENSYIINPNFSLLAQTPSDSCSSKKSRAWVIATVVTVCTVAFICLLVGLSIYLRKKRIYSHLREKLNSIKLKKTESN